MDSHSDEMTRDSAQLSDRARLGYTILAICAGLLAFAILCFSNPGENYFSGLRSISATLARLFEFVNSPLVLLLLAALLLILVLKGKLQRWRLVGAGYLIGSALAAGVLKLIRH